MGTELASWRGRVQMQRVTQLVVVAIMVMMRVERGTAQKMMAKMFAAPLDKCDFHFQGHESVPPIFKLQKPGQKSLSSTIVARDGNALLSGVTANFCVFQGGKSVWADEAEEMAEVCAKHFQLKMDKLETMAVSNVTELEVNMLKGRLVVLPLTAVDLLDGTKLRIGDGNPYFPERRRCLAFFTSSDLITVLDRLLNKEHRKKLAKIADSAERVRLDFNSLLVNIIQFL